MRIPLSFVAMALLAAGAPAQDVKPETIADVKAASVFIRNSIETHQCTGSGFVVASDGASMLIATNAHVISSEEYAKLSPSLLLAKLKLGKVTVLFGSGTPAERSATAEFVSIDPVADICLLRVKSAAVKDPPKALKVGGAEALVETNTVYSFGYPFGDALSTNKGPAVTVGKASISSLRTDESGKLAIIQIDGNLNPGNSGGPVIDTEGAVIGVATAIHRDGKGIGFVVPAAEVAAMLAGKVSLLGTRFVKQTDGRMKVSFEALVSDPAGSITGVTLHYKVVDPKADKFKEGSDLSAAPGVKSLDLKLVAEVARAEVLLDSTGGQLAFGARPSGAKKEWESCPTRLVSLGRAAAGGAAIGPDDKPPAGWKEIALDGGYITVWVPEKSGLPVDRTNTHRGPSVTVHSTVTQTLGDNGVIYRVERANLRLTGAGSIGAKLDTVGLRDAIAKGLAEELKGKIVEESDAKMGTWPCKEYVIRGTKDTAVVRIFVSIRSVTIAMVAGPPKLVSGDEGSLFLDSFRAHPRDPLAIAPPNIPAPPNPMFPTPAPPMLSGAGAKGGETAIIAGMFDPIYRDRGPAGGLLIGFELGLGKFFDSDVILSGRPIYRSNGVETFGAAQGFSKVTRLIKAKEGYAVGAVSISSGMTVNGLSITYMKIAGDTLDPKDSYESEWVGIAGRRADSKIGGTGTPVVGVVGKANPQTKYLTGLGLIYATPESAEPHAPVGGGFPNAPVPPPPTFEPTPPVGPSAPSMTEKVRPPNNSGPAPAPTAVAPAVEVGRWAILVGGAIAGIMLLIVIGVFAMMTISRRAPKKSARYGPRR